MPVFVLLWVVIRIVLGQPVVGAKRSALTVEPEALKRHVRTISEGFHPRDYQHPENLDGCADYVRTELAKTGAHVRIQEYEVAGVTYRNIIARFGSGDDGLIVVGAHYDACHHTPGADDNASGVAGLIELAGLLARHPLDRSVELVAYTLEEPPFFRTEAMGSAVHAAELRKKDAAVHGVIVLEMIGYFSDGWISQDYPLPFFRLFYPSRGDFIALAGRLDQWPFMRRFKSGMKGATPLPVWSVSGPASIPGLDFSDHLNYWAQGYDALMVTDTAFYRNRAYHSDQDTWDRLDYQRMSNVVVGVYEGIAGLGDDGKK